MKTKLIVHISLFLLVFAFPLYSQTYRMILTDDPVLEDLRFLILESGKPFLSFTPPLAPAEINNYLKSVNADSLSPAAQEAYNRIKARVAPEDSLSDAEEEPKLFTARFNIFAELEGRIRINSDETSLNRHYPVIPAAISAPIQLFFKDRLQFYVEPALVMRPGKYGEDVFEHNIPLEYRELDEQVPLRVFAAAGGDWWNFQLGRDHIVWGTGRTGSLSYSNESAYYNFARLSFFAKNFKYSMVVNQMPLELEDDMFSFPDESNRPEANEYLNKTTQRYFYMHRIDFSIKEKVSIGIMEGVMAGNSALELRFLNPLLLFHSLYAWRDYGDWLNDSGKAKQPDLKDSSMIGSFLSLEVNWNIINSLSFYGQFVMNEFATWDEQSNNPDQPPNALGFMAGLQYSHNFNGWASVFFLEFFYTDPYLYVLSSPFCSILQMHRYGGFDFIGYPRDTLALVLGGNVYNGNNLSFQAKVSWISRGESDNSGIVWNWEQTKSSVNKKTPSGSVENYYAVSLEAQWLILPRLALKSNITGILGEDSGGQISIGARYQLK